MSSTRSISPPSRSQEDDVKLAAMKTAELKEELRSRKLKTTGKKTELVLRLKEALDLERKHSASASNDDDLADDHESDEEDDTTDESSGDDEIEENEHETAWKTKRKNKKKYKCVFSFKDVEESLETFSGDDNANIIKWLEDFKEFAEMCK